jgi:uncharacterized membrane protein
MKAILDIISGIFWLVIRWLKIKDNPQNKYEAAKSDNAKAVTSGDKAAVNRALDRGVDWNPDRLRNE